MHISTSSNCLPATTKPAPTDQHVNGTAQYLLLNDNEFATALFRPAEIMHQRFQSRPPNRIPIQRHAYLFRSSPSVPALKQIQDFDTISFASRNGHFYQGNKYLGSSR
jgi:hypothetical protein